MTDSSGFPLSNVHDGTTTIQGDLIVQGNIFDQAGARRYSRSKS